MWTKRQMSFLLVIQSVNTYCQYIKLIYYCFRVAPLEPLITKYPAAKSIYNWIQIYPHTNRYLNDLAPKDVWSFYVKEKKLGRSGENLPFHVLTPIPLLTCRYQTLISTIKRLNTNCKLGFLGILPRPYDHHRNKIHHVEANRQLQTICMESEISFIRTHTSFLKFGKTIDNLFIDGLHLNYNGSLQLRKLIFTTINRFRSEDKLNK